MFTIKTEYIYKQIVLVSYIFVIVYLMSKGILNRFINPKLDIYIIISVCIIGVFLLIQNNIFSKKDTNKVKSKFKVSDIVYLLPIFLLFYLNDGNLSQELINNKGLVFGSVKSTNQVKQVSNPTPSNEDESIDESVDITVFDSTYINIMEKVFENLDSYMGKTIKIKGVIYKDQNLPNGTFVLGRLHMYCCTADAQTIGYISYLDKEEVNITPQQGLWYEAKGKIEKVNYDGEDLPKLLIYEMEEIDKPTDIYVY